MQLTDISTIKKICSEHGFELTKGFGQNFIVNKSICPQIVSFANINEEYGVLEIGPGIGVLTKELAQSANKVVALEIDKRLPDVLKETLSEFDNVKIILQDVLKADLSSIISEEFDGLKVAVCANLPYYITSPIIMKLLEERLPIEHITVMVQKEAAERLCAKTGTRQAGAITYAVQYYASTEMLFEVSPGSFYPPPKVTSCVMQFNLHKKPPVKPKNEKFMFQIIKAAFSQRRKTAANAISAGTSIEKAKIISVIEEMGLNAAIRPEKITLEEYAQLSDMLANC